MCYGFVKLMIRTERPLHIKRVKMINVGFSNRTSAKSNQQHLCCLFIFIRNIMDNSADHLVQVYAADFNEAMDV